MRNLSFHLFPRAFTGKILQAGDGWRPYHFPPTVSHIKNLLKPECRCPPIPVPVGRPVLIIATSSPVGRLVGRSSSSSSSSTLTPTARGGTARRIKLRIRNDQNKQNSIMYGIFKILKAFLSGEPSGRRHFVNFMGSAFRFN